MLPGYMDGIVEAGGTPLMLPLTLDDEMLAQHGAVRRVPSDGRTRRIAGALRGDADQSLRRLLPGARRHGAKAFALALEKDKPVLGICRGIQFLNAVLGGTLYQDLPQQKPSELSITRSLPYDVPSHEVTIVEDTPLYELLGGGAPFGQQPPPPGGEEAVAAPYGNGVCRRRACGGGLYEGKIFCVGRAVAPEFSYKTEESSRRILGKFVEAAQSTGN